MSPTIFIKIEKGILTEIFRSNDKKTIKGWILERDKNSESGNPDLDIYIYDVKNIHEVIEPSF